MEEKTNALVALSDGIADATEKASRAVVRVNGRRRRPGSGIVYAEDLVLTASHAVEREEDLSVETGDGRTLGAELVGRDNRNDLAVLRVEGLGASEVAAPAPEAPKVGQLALAVGRPGGTPGEGVRASFGVVSAAGSMPTGRGGRHGRGRLPERYVQADAAPYPGLGGGPLVDADGAVVGVVVAALGGATIAIPADVAWDTAKALEERGTAKRGYLGVYSQPVRLPDGRGMGLTQQGGLLVVGVGDDTPASRAGIIIGDILATVDGQPVEDTEDLLVVLDGDRAGKTVPLQVVRGGELERLEVTVGERG